MITAIDFGLSEIRTAFRSPQQPGRLNLIGERSGYCLVPDRRQHRASLDHQGISYAECDGVLAVVGNQITAARWLSRVPVAPLIQDSLSASADPSARQMLNVLVEAMLPACNEAEGYCAVVLPGNDSETDFSLRQREFLSRLVRMRGYEVMPLRASEAAMLSTSHESFFTGCTVVIGAEHTEVCLSRNGIPLAFRECLAGGNGIDRELARQFRMHIWDGDGTCYLDTETVCGRKHEKSIDLFSPVGDFECAMAGYYEKLIDQVLRMISSALFVRPRNMATTRLMKR